GGNPSPLRRGGVAGGVALGAWLGRCAPSPLAGRGPVAALGSPRARKPPRSVPRCLPASGWLRKKKRGKALKRVYSQAVTSGSSDLHLPPTQYLQSLELESLQAKLPRYLRNLFSHDADVLVWHALLLPEKPPYNLKAFHLRINFPEDYPFKPPTVTFTTRIYHPNVGHNGEVCLPIISKENWSPYTKTCQVLEALNVLVNRPDLGQPVRLELADLLKQDPELFHREAREFTLKYGVDRPS
uniref:UBC core domain-containing protein n=2 Tax=Felis catus TaxID=9685 RepID=A0ABI7Z9Y7_FELCA